jgi:uncharacterized membrane protein YccC
MAAGLRPAEATMTMAVGIVLGLALVLIAAVFLSPSLQIEIRWFLLLLALTACVLTAWR